MSPSREDPRGLIRYALVGAALTVILVAALYLVRGALLLIYVSALVAIGLGPLVTTLERRGLGLATRQRVPRWLAILAIYLFIIGVLVGIGLLVLPPLVTQARELWSQIPQVLHDAQQWLIDRGWLSRELSMQEAVQLAPVKTVSAWLGGQMLLAGIIGATAALGLFLMGVPYFYVLALSAGVGEFIPIVGPLLSAIPAIAVAFTVSPTLALGITIFFIAQQQLENHVLVPKVMERQVGVSAVVVVIALLLGGSLLGVVGAILAVPTAAILQVVFEELSPDTGDR